MKLNAHLFDLRNEGVKVRPSAGREFGMERFAIDADFEGAAAGWDQGERRNPIAELENLSRQTDGFRRVVSNRAVFDPYFGFHQELLPEAKLLGSREWVKARLEGCARGRHGRLDTAVVRRRRRWPRACASWRRECACAGGAISA